MVKIVLNAAFMVALMTGLMSQSFAQANTGADRAQKDRKEVQNSMTLKDKARTDPKLAAEVKRVEAYDKPVKKDVIMNSVGPNAATAAAAAAAKAAKQSYDDKQREKNAGGSAVNPREKGRNSQ